MASRNVSVTPVDSAVVAVHPDSAHAHAYPDSLLPLRIPEGQALSHSGAVMVHALEVALHVSQPGVRVELAQLIRIRNVDFHVAVVHLQLFPSRDAEHTHVTVHTFDREVRVIRHFDAEVYRVL